MVVILDTSCSEVVWSVLATHSIRLFLLHFPSRASPCAITFQLHSTCLWRSHFYLSAGILQPLWARQKRLITYQLFGDGVCGAMRYIELIHALSTSLQSSISSKFERKPAGARIQIAKTKTTGAVVSILTLHLPNKQTNKQTSIKYSNYTACLNDDVRLVYRFGVVHELQIISMSSQRSIEGKDIHDAEYLLD